MSLDRVLPEGTPEFVKLPNTNPDIANLEEVINHAMGLWKKVESRMRGLILISIPVSASLPDSSVTARSGQRGLPAPSVTDLSISRGVDIE